MYSLVGRRDKWFVFLELTASIIFICVGLLLVGIKQDAVRGVSIFILFVITGLLSHVILSKHSLQAYRIGIIDFVWICIMGGTNGIIAFTKGVSPFVDSVQVGLSHAYYKNLFNMTEFLLGKTIDSVFLLGGVLAACMSILWVGGVWRKSGESDLAHYKFATMAAIKMVVAYFIVVLNALIWIAVPLYQKMNELTAVLK